MPTILSSLQSNTLTLTLNRLQRANAFNAEMIDALLRALREAEGQSEVRCVVIRGAGRVFSSGQDITEMQPGEQISYREHLDRTYNPLVLQIRRMGQPVIAAVNGACAGAALGVALACDLRIAHARAYFVVGFGGIALAPDSGVSLLLPHYIGLGRAQEFFYSNKPIRARQALRWGMVNQVRNLGFERQVESTAGALARGPATAFALGKQAFNQAVLPNLEEALACEGLLQDQAGRSVEHQQGVSAFLKKRRPEFG